MTGPRRPLRFPPITLGRRSKGVNAEAPFPYRSSKRPYMHARASRAYMVERQINGRPLDERLAVRQTKSKPLAAAFKAWLEQQLPKISGKSDLARAIRYGLSRWQSFTLFLEEEPTVAIGRVGDWRGGVRNWGVVVFQLLSRHAGASFQSIAPFPVAAHQTGRADFPHPAFS